MPAQETTAALQMVSLSDKMVFGITNAWSVLTEAGKENKNRPMRRRIAREMVNLFLGPMELAELSDDQASKILEAIFEESKGWNP